MRTTITLADDVVVAVEALRRERSIGLSEAVNELVRGGLAAGSAAPRAFSQETHDLGAGIDFSNVGEALDLLDGPGSR